MLALVVTYYNNKSNLDRFLQSLEKNSSHNFTLFIADLSESLSLSKDYPFPTKIIPGENRGYSHGVNLCLKKALSEQFDQFCVLNYDAVAPVTFIEQILKGFMSADVFGGKIYYQKGYEFHEDRYAKKDLGHILWYAGGTLDWDNAYVKHRGVNEIDSGQYDTFEKTEFISGCLFCFAKVIVDKVGFWDERYFLYYEDADYSVRIKNKGFTLYYNPDIVLYHKNAGSTGGPGSLLHQRTQMKSQLYFGIKFAPLRTKLHLIKNYLHLYLSTNK